MMLSMRRLGGFPAGGNLLRCILMMTSVLVCTSRSHVQSSTTFPGVHACDNAVNGSCPRCSPHHPHICCDLCNPEEFEDMFQVPNPGSKNQPRRSKIKDYVQNENDKKLRKWLDDWRRKTTKEVHGEQCLRYYGPSNIMLTETFDRICDAAHHNLIASVDDLFKESRWFLTYKYGQIVVDAIKEIIPVDPLPSESHPTKTRQPPKCSSCGQVGHTSGSSMEPFSVHDLQITL